jgi:hypothetical protein
MYILVEITYTVSILIIVPVAVIFTLGPFIPVSDYTSAVVRYKVRVQTEYAVKGTRYCIVVQSSGVPTWHTHYKGEKQVTRAHNQYKKSS